MNPRIKQLWIKDLIEHPDLQTQGKLRNNGKYCCLGRLSLLAEDEKVGHFDGDVFISNSPHNDDECEDSENAEFDYDEDHFHESDTELIEEVKDWAGLLHYKLMYQDNSVSFEALNDGQDLSNIPAHSFKEIAALIKEQL